MSDWNLETLCAAGAVGLIVARAGTELWLDRLNQRHVRQHEGSVPDAFRESIDAATYAKSVRYTLAKGRFGQVEGLYDTALLLVILFSGVLPWLYDGFGRGLGASASAQALFLLTAGFLMTLPGLPFEWYGQFRLEERFGFNTTKLGTWVFDRVKGAVLLYFLGFPILLLVLKIVDWTGRWWWLWAWAAVVTFQLLMTVLAPVLILPLFNKFTPLPDGPLRDRLLSLAQRTGFRARGIQVMDGSKRSKHSNAFFTGFGKLRKIVLFDTLIEQLSEAEMEAVLAHEIGHYRRRHIPKTLVRLTVGLLAMFGALAWLLSQPWFFGAFGFASGSVAPGFLLFGLLAGSVTFWLSPVLSRWSRRYEYEADAYAARAMGEANSLIAALRKLSEKNLSNLTPHPLYSSFYYSHPTLLERENSLRKLSFPADSAAQATPAA